MHQPAADEMQRGIKSVPDMGPIDSDVWILKWRNKKSPFTARLPKHPGDAKTPKKANRFVRKICSVFASRGAPHQPPNGGCAGRQLKYPPIQGGQTVAGSSAAY